MNASDVGKLREATGAGIMECKKALTEANGDFEVAKKVLYERGLARAEKKSDRATGAGLLHSYIHLNRVGVLLDVRCETDFVARTDAFKDFAHSLAMHIAACTPSDVDALLSQPFVRDEQQTISDVIKSVIANVGENIRVERFTRYEL